MELKILIAFICIPKVLTYTLITLLTLISMLKNASG